MNTIFLRIIATILLSYFMCTSTDAQIKMVEVQRDRWIHEGWITFASVGYFAGDHPGVQLDLLNFKLKYFSIGLWSSYIFSPLVDKFFDDSDFWGFSFWAPVGFYYPLFTGSNFAVGFDSRANIFRSYDSGQRFGEISLRLDLKYAASFQIGYRFPDDDFEYDRQKFNFGGLFLNISAGLQILNLNRIPRNVMVKGPPPSLSVRWDRRWDDIILMYDKPSAEIDLVIANDGEGIAEDVELKVQMEITPENEVTYINTRPNLGDIPDYSVRGSRVILKASEEITKYEEIPITFHLIEKDGFRAEKTYNLVLLPRVQPEHYPPILTTDIQFNDENNNGVLDANERAEIMLTIHNEGRGNAWSLDGSIALQNEEHIPGFDLLKTDFSVRYVKLGSSENVRIPVRATKELPTTELEFIINIQEANGFDLAPIQFHLDTQEFQPPQLHVGELTVRNESGESVIVPIDVIEFTIRIENKGEGVAEDVIFSVSPGENIFIVDAVGDSYRQRIGLIEPGAYRDVTFEAFCNRHAESFRLMISVDERGGEYGVWDYELDLEVYK